MNKQELIEEIEKIGKLNLEMFGYEIECIPVASAVKLIEQLDEPRKAKVKQFVADWIERSKQEKRNIRNALNNGGEKMRLWFLDQENYDLFARAWLDGYEVEEEKRYMVRVRGICGNHEFLNCEKHSKKWLFSDRKENTLYDTKFTRKQLEDADFGWVFDCPGVEVEEVE